MTELVRKWVKKKKKTMETKGSMRTPGIQSSALGNGASLEENRLPGCLFRLERRFLHRNERRCAVLFMADYRGCSGAFNNDLGDGGIRRGIQ